MSLLIKTLVLVVSVYYIWTRLAGSPLVISPSMLTPGRSSLLPVIFLMMFLNWGLEATKWKILAAPLERISFTDSFKAVFSGVSVSLLTPNRIGEFAARVLFLQKADRISASIASLLGSIAQLMITVFAGIWAWFFLEKRYYDFFRTDSIVSTDVLLWATIALLVGMWFLWNFLLKNNLRFRKHLEVLSKYSRNEKNLIWILSLLRYLVFSLQYYLTLQLFGINAGIFILLPLIALTFFVTSVIPTFALTEIAVRTGAAVYFFSTISNDLNGIIASSLFLWLVNIAVPALIGSFFIWKLKLFRES